MTLLGGPNYTVGEVTSATVSITDPPLPVLSINDVVVTEASGMVYATFTVTRTGDTSGTSTVSYNTSNGTAMAGIPVSTTQTISGSIMGVGAIQRFSAVRWGVAGRILWAWILTIPASAIVAGATWGLLRLLAA